MWGYVYDRTVRDLADCGAFPLAGLCEPRIEPEIVFGLARAPARAWTKSADRLRRMGGARFRAGAVDLSGLAFSAADTVAANGLHGALLIGERHPVGATRRNGCARSRHSTSTSTATAGPGPRPRPQRDGGPALDAALCHGPARHDVANPPLAAGEIVTTGTLTRALPVAPGETWSTEPFGRGIRWDFGAVFLAFPPLIIPASSNARPSVGVNLSAGAGCGARSGTVRTAQAEPHHAGWHSLQSVATLHTLCKSPACSLPRS